MYDFFSIFTVENNNNNFFVYNYLLRSYSSGRCVFFNPKEKKCVIYSVRPHICKLYPFMIAYDLKKKVVIIYVDKNHEFIGDREINRQDLKKQAFEYIKDRISHYTVFENETGIEIRKDEPDIDDFTGVDVERYNKYKEESKKRTIKKERLCDPFLNNKLIEKNEYLWKRIDKGLFK